MSSVSKYKTMYATPILEKLIEMVTEIDFIKSASKGTLSGLPSPEYFKDIMPIILITPGRVENEWVNENPETGILNQTYNYKIIYVRSIDLETGDENLILETLMDEGEQIAEMLTERQTLDDLTFDFGKVLGSLVKDVDFDSNSYRLFKDLEVPAVVCEMNMKVYFRTLKLF